MRYNNTLEYKDGVRRLTGAAGARQMMSAAPKSTSPSKRCP